MVKKTQEMPCRSTSVDRVTMNPTNKGLLVRQISSVPIFWLYSSSFWVFYPLSQTATLCWTALMTLSPKMHTGHTAHGYGLMGPNLKRGQGTSDPDSWHSSSQDSQSHNLLLNLQEEKSVFESHWDRKKKQPQTHKTHRGWPMLFTVPLLATRWPSDCRCSLTG